MYIRECGTDLLTILGPNEQSRDLVKVVHVLDKLHADDSPLSAIY